MRANNLLGISALVNEYGTRLTSFGAAYAREENLSDTPVMQFLEDLGGNPWGVRTVQEFVEDYRVR